jgi:hypothetical protein
MTGGEQRDGQRCADCMRQVEPAIRKATAAKILRISRDTPEPLISIVRRVARGGAFAKEEM